MVVLHLSLDHWQMLQAHAAKTYPQECCGLLIGTRQQRDDLPSIKMLQAVLPTANAWSPELKDWVPEGFGLSRTRRDCYWIAPEVLLQTQQYARSQNLEILGVYHSHPDHPALPSEMDRTLAWPQYTYLILAVRQGRVEDGRAWTLDDNHNFQPETIVTRECAKIDPSV